jgi:phosphoglycolate phosphatase-like HAD superfamily hydrolase
VLRTSADDGAIDDLAMRELAFARAAMIGDSLPDVQAARAAGMPVAGVGWGFDPDGEMRRVAVDWWFEGVAELGRAVCP